MNKDPLEIIIDEIKLWIEKNEMVIFPGSTEDETLVVYQFERLSNLDWEEFLKIAKRLNVSLVVIEKELNFLKTFHEDLYNEICSDEDLDSRLKEKYQNAFEHENELALVILNFHYEQICYRFEIRADWYYDYLLTSRRIDDLDDVNPNSSLQLNERIHLTEDEIEDFSRKIIGHEDFALGKNRAQKRDVIKKILKKILPPDYDETTMSYGRIIWRVDEIYESEIKPIHELEIKRKVLDLKAQGVKKVEIRSRLDISSGMVDRFYYAD
jgi:hypothetical protein